MKTPFADILRIAVERTPRAFGGAFAASDGEMVDYFSESDPDEFAFITAHYGVIFRHVVSAFNTCHYGEASLLVIEHESIEILVRGVQEGYYALMAIDPPAPLAKAMLAMEDAVIALREEMG